MNRRLIALSGLTLAASAVVFAPRADAANDAMMELLNVLKEQGTITEEAYEQLSSASKADDEANTADTAQMKQAAETLPKIETKGKLEISSPEGDFKFGVGGRVQVDAAWYNEDDTDAGETTNLDSGVEFRRTRLSAFGTLWKHWDFKSEVDFAGNGVDVKDMYIANTYLKPFTIQAGNFKEPFSLEQLTSSRFITFMERSLADAFVPERNLGAALYYAGSNWTAAGGVFSEGVTEDDEDVEIDGGEGIGVTGRITAAPLLDSTRLVHVGGAISWRDPEESPADTLLQFRQRPESHVADQRLVDTGEFAGTEDFMRYGAEGAFAWGPGSLQAEYIYTDVNRNIEDVSFDGWYIYGSWFLTGESRAAAYKVEKGAFDRLKPFSNFGSGGWGAWEIAARYSTIDLSDEDIDGGEQDDFTFGLNWYPNPNLRLMANYVKVLSIDDGEFEGASPDIFQLRAQVDW
ncbi:MAG: porin [Pseudomonadota bacterium]|nr:porin [Pseudomonadota bacterium]